MIPDITIACVKWQDGSPHFGGRGAEYVNRLYAGVCRHVHRHAIDFVCFTDSPEGIRPEVRLLPLPNGLWGSWPKIGLFARTLPGVRTERLLYFDLACVIVGELDTVIDLAADFAICRDWPPEMHPDDAGYASGAFLLRIGSRPLVAEAYGGDPEALRGDQDWITQSAPGAVLFPYDWTPSYKLRNLRACPPDAKWIMFHGRPKPHECGGWIDEHWRD